MSEILSFQETVARIQAGAALLVAGRSAMLAQLPAGHWIGAVSTIAMKPDGAGPIGDNFCVTELPACATNFKICEYTADTLMSVATDAYENGYSLIVFPSQCDVHFKFATCAPEIPELFLHPLIGFVASTDSMLPDGTAAFVFNGESATRHEDRALVMHVELPPNRVATIGIINVYQQDDGPDICFAETGFSAERCLIDSQDKPISPYVCSQLPQDIWVANYSGAMINLHLRSYDPEGEGPASFYGPFFKGVRYRHARVGIDYAQQYREEVAKLDTKDVILAVNCVGNYSSFKLKGTILNDLIGPYTFGEIAYQQLNATYVYLRILSTDSNS